MTSTAFYCASSSLYFPGAVAMINSLRLQGHTEPVFVLDCGLSPSQRELLERESTVIEMPRDASPHLLKTVVPRQRPAETMVLIDVDMIVTRPLTPLLDSARAGRVVAFANDVDRFVPEWGEVLDLGVARRRTYVSSGFVVFSGALGGELLDLWDDRQERIDFARSCFAAADPDYPLLFVDQDVLNAVIATRLEAAQLDAIDARLAALPPFDGLRVTDSAQLRCRYRDGTQPYLLHHFDRKPWVSRLRSNPYSRLLTRLLLADDVPMRLSPHELPPRLRAGGSAGAARLATDTLLVPAGIARRLRERAAARRGAEPEGTR